MEPISRPPPTTLAAPPASRPPPLRARLSLRAEATLAAALGALLLAGSVLGLQLSLAHAEDRLRWVAHTHEVIGAAQSLARDATEAQSGLRGYSLSREASFLRELGEGEASFERDAAHLQELVGDNPPQVERVKKLRALQERWRATAVQPTLRPGANAQLPADADAQALQLRNALAAFVGVEEELLRARQDASESSTRQLDLVSVAGALLVMLVGGGGFVLFARRVAQRLASASASARAIAKGEHAARLDASGVDELAELARAFNEMAAQLEARDREAQGLKSLREMLHAAHALEDAQRIVEALLPRCLPGSHGRLHLLNASRNLLVPAAGWGGVEAGEPFAPDACWSFRLGRAHFAGGARGGVACEHSPLPGGAATCIPLMAQGETVGLFELGGEGDVPAVVTEVGEILALTVANLRLREAMKSQATRDPLTGLYNRRYLEETMAREIARARRAGAPIAVVMLDVDHFKQFNDTHGHAAGDSVLKEVANALRATFRAADVVCRYGGEEFLVLMPECSLADAVRRTEAVRSAVAALRPESDGRALGGVTISAGVACFPAHGQDEETLVHAADAALYRSKREGRDRVSAADPPPASPADAPPAQVPS